VLVALAEPVDVPQRFLERAQFVALLFEVVERRGDVRDHRLVDRGERLRQGA